MGAVSSALYRLGAHMGVIQYIPDPGAGTPQRQIMRRNVRPTYQRFEGFEGPLPFDPITTGVSGYQLAPGQKVPQQMLVTWTAPATSGVSTPSYVYNQKMAKSATVINANAVQAAGGGVSPQMLAMGGVG